jgi:hypothetical protein
MAEVGAAVRTHRDQSGVELVRMPVDRRCDIGNLSLMHVHRDLDLLAAQPLGVPFQVELRLVFRYQVRLSMNALWRLTLDNVQQQQSRGEPLRKRASRGQHGLRQP